MLVEGEFFSHVAYEWLDFGYNNIDIKLSEKNVIQGLGLLLNRIHILYHSLFTIRMEFM